MGLISLLVPQVGLPDTTEDVKVANNFVALANGLNGNLDGTNLSATAAQAAGVNQPSQTVKGAFVKSASDTTSSTTFTSLGDVVSSVVVGSGFVELDYFATWSESVSGAASAAIFIGSNQLQVAADGTTGSTRGVQSINGTGAGAGNNGVLTTFPLGLIVAPGGASYVGDATTGQAFGVFCGAGVASPAAGFNIGLVNTSLSGTSTFFHGGSCKIFLPGGMYSFGVQFKASSGTVTVSSRRLYVRAVSFA